MPELPEVECLTRAVRRVAEGGTLVEATFLREDLREIIPVGSFRAMLEGKRIDGVLRRSKYMLLAVADGYGIFHLGMSGNILQFGSAAVQLAHTHAVFTIRRAGGGQTYLHFVDPRRFGRIDCVAASELNAHALFTALGPEPLDHPALGEHLYAKSRKKGMPIKPFIMDSRNVVGVGNIYASEALFRAGISPERPAGSVSRARYERLGREIQLTLEAAISSGGTSFRDFRNPDGNPGYFAVSLNAYDREGEPCLRCGRAIQMIRQSGRATYFCRFCQT